MPTTAAVRITHPVETGFDARVVEDAAERRIAEGLARLDAQRATLDQSLLEASPATNETPTVIPADGDYIVSVTSDGISETVTITMTGNSIPVVTASTRDEIQTWAQAQAMKIWQDRVARSWMASTSSTTSATTINLGSSWHISTAGTSTTSGWYDIGDRCTAAANAAWYSTGWQDCDHATMKKYGRVRETPEQAADRAAKAELARQAAVIEAAKVKVFTDTAKARARRLLFSMLNADQQKELDEKNHFHLTVHSRDGSIKVYRIEHGYAGNVKLLGVDGQPVKRYCIHADYRLPYEDQMLAQKLMLETNEPEFLRIANMTQLRAA
jgi:hypothetical protein